MQFEQASNYIQEELKSKLSPILFYHNYAHTMYVLKSAIEIAEAENISDNESLTLLKTAALFHDTGFLKTYEGETEAEACKIAEEALVKFDYTKEQIEIICRMIMKTKMPQQPVTHLEKILCDADLNYLGTESFVSIGNNLLKELNAHGKEIGEKEWDELQIDFLSSHHYWTESAIAKRENKKTENLNRLKQLVYQNK